MMLHQSISPHGQYAIAAERWPVSQQFVIAGEACLSLLRERLADSSGKPFDLPVPIYAEFEAVRIGLEAGWSAISGQTDRLTAGGWTVVKFDPNRPHEKVSL